MHLLIIGGSDAGISAGLRAREVDPSLDVTVVVADAYPNFSICGLPFYLSGETPDWRDLAHRTRADLEGHGLQLRLDTLATRVDAQAHLLDVEGPGGDADALPYDRLVIGTGAEPVTPPIDGLDLPDVHVLHSMGEAFAVRRSMEGARRALVVGAGYIGVEMADAFTHAGLATTLVEQLDTVMPTVEPALGRHLVDELHRHGVDVRLGTTVKACSATDGGVAVHGTPDLDVEVDVVVVAVGVRPLTALAETAGAAVGSTGAVAVDRAMRCGVEDVFVAGDCVETWHRLLQRHTWLPLGTTAHKQGRVAGENAAGGSAEFAGSLGTQVVKVFDLAVARTGLLPDEAADAGFNPITHEVTVDDHKAYYPGATPMHLRITGDRDGRLLGAQIVGAADAQVAKRVDTVATALFHEMAVADLEHLDLSYTPPFSSPYDPVQMAAKTWALEVGAR